MSNLVKRLNECIEDYGISRTELSKRTGLTQATISRYLSNKMTPTGENLALLADVFDVSVDYLLGRTDIKEINRGDKIETIAANRDGGVLDEITNMDDLKKLILETVKEDKNK
ncbi:helix-turn-helix domain-containing protein [Peptostreptococcus equinus]|uniref:Helix-turn-helix transcriptional regulator n=1 Tax=Peptostreptococcus equinus TaxID=3003601 RepID=A0ABY7JUU1_9FIRM|nr:helix-turn-helix transcriptional regulator [Peptostreptococcus sp. CBA3647]WAW15750.1 helix-turn-helix transcriptional regulator [Peptostreptococcus sp. CBA3647]